MRVKVEPLAAVLTLLLIHSFNSNGVQLEGHLGKRRITWILRITEDSKTGKTGDEGRIYDSQDSGAV